MAKQTKRYRVTATLTISVSTLVEATSKRQATKLARERPVVSLCHQCAGGDDSAEWVTSGELDGEPDQIVVSDAS